MGEGEREGGKDGGREGGREGTDGGREVFFSSKCTQVYTILIKVYMHAIIIRVPMTMPAPGVFVQMQLIE